MYVADQGDGGRRRKEARGGFHCPWSSEYFRVTCLCLGLEGRRATEGEEAGVGGLPLSTFTPNNPFSVLRHGPCATQQWSGKNIWEEWSKSSGP